MIDRRKSPEREFVRFSYNNRLQHLFMFVPFIILVLTGFPVKFPENGFWALFIDLFGGVESMRRFHRMAAVVMMADFVFHIIYIIYKIIRNKTPLARLPLLPGPKDLRDLIQNLRYFLFLTDERPRFHKFSYIEKFDYWAVFWGMFIMAGSGLILWFPERVGSVLPSEVIQIAYVAHSDEALLAFLAIAIWHFYNVHFNPRIWPANKVWYKGTLTESEMRHEHPLELEEILEAEQKADRRTRQDEEGEA